MLFTEVFTRTSFVLSFSRTIAAVQASTDSSLPNRKRSLTRGKSFFQITLRDLLVIFSCDDSMGFELTERSAHSQTMAAPLEVNE